MGIERAFHQLWRVLVHGPVVTQSVEPVQSVGPVCCAHVRTHATEMDEQRRLLEAARRLARIGEDIKEMAHQIEHIGVAQKDPL